MLFAQAGFVLEKQHKLLELLEKVNALRLKRLSEYNFAGSSLATHLAKLASGSGLENRLVVTGFLYLIKLRRVKGKTPSWDRCAFAPANGTRRTIGLRRRARKKSGKEGHHI